jgi:iron complex outermembrane receptor protein
MFFSNTYFKLNTQTAFAQNNPAPDETSTEGYTLIDIGVGASFDISNQRINIGFAVNNLLDTKYIDHLSTLKEVGYFNPGRNIAFSMKIPFDLK